MPSLIASLGIEASAFRAGLVQADREAQRWGAQIGGSLSKTLVGWGGGIAAAYMTASGISNIVGEMMTSAREIKFGSAELGVTAQRWQDLSYQAQRAGSSIETVAGAYVYLAKAINEAKTGNKEVIADFKVLGIEAGKLRHTNPDEAFQQIQHYINSLGQISDSEVVAMRKVLGKGSARLVGGMVEGIFSTSAPVKMNVAEYEDANWLAKRKRELTETWFGFRPWFRDIRKHYDALSALSGEALGYNGSGWFMRRWGPDNENLISRSRLSPGVSLADTLNDDKKAEEAEKRDKERERLQAERVRKDEQLQAKRAALRRQQLETDMASMSPAQKLLTIESERARLAQELFRAKEEGRRIEAAMDIEALDQKAIDIRNRAESRTTADRPRVNEMQRIGAYAGLPPEHVSLQLHRQNERHLSAIERHISRLVGKEPVRY